MSKEAKTGRVTFVKDFNWHDPDQPGRTVAYKKGMTLKVEKDCEEKARAAGALKG